MEISERDCAIRLRYLRLDDARKSLLPEFWRLIESHLDGILKDFYQHLFQFDEPRELIEKHAQIESLIAAQKNHWKALMTGAIDRAFMNRVLHIGLTHQRIGMAPRWYLGGYSLLTERMFGVIDRAYRRNAKKRMAMISAVNAALFLDMDLSIDAYEKAEIEAHTARQHRLDAMIAEFRVRIWRHDGDRQCRGVGRRWARRRDDRCRR